MEVLNYTASLSYLIAIAVLTTLLLLALTLAWNFPSLIRLLSPQLSTGLCLLAIVLLAFGLRVALAPFYHDDFFNEWAFMEGGQTIFKRLRYIICFFGDTSRCMHPQVMLPPHPPGFPALLGLAFSLFGTSDQVAFNVNLFLGSLATIPAYALGRLLSDRQGIGLYSAFFVAVTPALIRYSGTGLLAESTLFFLLLTGACLLAALRLQNRRIWLLFLTSLTYTLQLRPEAMLFCLPLSVAIFVRPKDKGRRWPRGLSPWQLAVLLLAVPAWLNSMGYFLVGMFRQETAGPSFALRYLRNNFIPYATYWIRPSQQLLVATPLALWGAWNLWSQNRRALAFLATWFLAVVLFFMLYHVDTSTHTGFRYMVAALAPYCLFMGYGAYSLQQFIQKYLRPAALGAALIVLATFLCLPAHTAWIGHQDRPRQAQMELLDKSRGKIPPGCLVVGSNAVFSLQRPVVYYHLLVGGQVSWADLRRVTTCLFLLKDLSTISVAWDKRAPWDKIILARCPHQVIVKVPVQLDREGRKVHQYALYRLDLAGCH